MNILPIPNISHPNCSRFRFVCPVKALARKSLKRQTKIEKYFEYFDSFIKTVNDIVLGQSYFSVTGITTEQALKFELNTEGNGGFFEFCLACPIHYDPILFSNLVVSTWKSMPIASDNIFIADMLAGDAYRRVRH